MRNATFLVEGYHDRSFLSGCLLHRGWTDPGKGSSGRIPVRNPVTGKAVTGGRHAFVAPSASTFVEISPNQGDTDLLGVLGKLAKHWIPPDPDELVVVLDVDVDGSQLLQGIARREQSVHDRLVRSDPGTTREGSSWTLSTGVRVRLALWTCESEDCRGVPDAHTLERIISAAIAKVYPERAEAVQTWLDGRPTPFPRTTAKDHSWSYMAGWYAELGCDAFLSDLWGKDPKIAAALEESLSSSRLDAILRSFE